MNKQLKDLFVFKERNFKIRGVHYKFVQVYYDDNFLGYGAFAIKKDGYILSGFSYEDFSKYFSLSRKGLLDIIVEYVTNTYGVKIDTN